MCAFFTKIWRDLSVLIREIVIPVSWVFLLAMPMLFKYKTKPEYHFKHFEIYVIETYPDYFNTENCMLRDIHYIKNFFFTFDMSKFHMVLFVLIFFSDNFLRLSKPRWQPRNFFQSCAYLVGTQLFGDSWDWKKISSQIRTNFQWNEQKYQMSRRIAIS